MNFFKKNKNAATDVADAAQSAAAEPTNTSIYDGLTTDAEPQTETHFEPPSAADGDAISKEDVRRAEFLAMLAEEERAHREKMQSQREPSTITFDADKTADPAFEDDQSKATAQSVYTPPQDTVAKDIAPKDTSWAAADAPGTTGTPQPEAKAPQSRADALGLGGANFLAGSNKDFAKPNFEAELSDRTKPVDVTPARNETQPFVDTVDASIDMGQPLTRRMNMGDLRLDVARITSDIDNGEALYRRAQQRVSSLLTFVERAEVDFSLLDRLEPENRRLKARNRTLSAEVETQGHKINVLSADLEEHRKRLAEVKAQYETANGSLARSMKAVADRDREIKRLNGEMNNLALKMERLRTSGEVETRENAVLRDRIAQMSDAMETLKTERTTLSKITESLKIDCDDHRSSRDRLQSEVTDLRHALDSAQRQNNQMKGEMVALHEEITTFKTQYEFNIISRDDRIYALEAQIEDLTKQVEIKDGIVANAAKDVSELRKNRTAQDLERERLEKMIQGQSMQLDDAQSALLKSKENMQELDQRYRDVAAALSVTQSRRHGQLPATAPDIHPEMDMVAQQAQAQASTQPPAPAQSSTSSPTPSPAPSHATAAKAPATSAGDAIDRELGGLRAPTQATKAQNAPQMSQAADLNEAQKRIDEFSGETEQSIEDRIMDYKLGLRKNIF